ncbi:MAG TPA: hypothetical protein VMT16_16190, partial [Thermoanaerobaculia bacterium]|nr:hypothetical protein [Thermoanaerobaculia bacterium]
GCACGAACGYREFPDGPVASIRSTDAASASGAVVQVVFELRDQASEPEVERRADRVEVRFAGDEQ